jgi:hypothetical protein
MDMVSGTQLEQTVLTIGKGRSCALLSSSDTAALVQAPIFAPLPRKA